MASYRKKHIKSKIHKIKPKKSIFKKPWFWIVLLCLIIILVVFYFALFYSGFQLKNIIILGNSTVKTQDLQDIVSEHANTGLITFWNVKITSRSIFLINEDKINKDILEKFPEIEKLTINKNLPQTLILDVTERKQVGVFCNETEQCLSIDDNGIIFGPLISLPVNTTVMRQTIDNGQIFTGEQALAKNIIDIILKIQKSLKDNFQIDLREALIASPARLNIETNENWEIYFDLSAGPDISLQITKLNLLLSGGISASERKNLRYIDLRPKDKAIICDNSTCGGG